VPVVACANAGLAESGTSITRVKAMVLAIDRVLARWERIIWFSLLNSLVGQFGELNAEC
jgi:hypothetical protein